MAEQTVTLKLTKPEALALLGGYLGAQNAPMALSASLLLRQQAGDPTWPRDPVKARGAAIMRSSISRGLGAMLGILAQSGRPDEWRAARMPYLLALATQVAKVGDPAGLAALRARAQSTCNATDDPTLKAHLQYMARTLGAGTRCSTGATAAHRLATCA